MQYWFYLAGAIALEAAGTTSMKLSGGFTNLVPSIMKFSLSLIRILKLVGAQ